MNPSKKRKATRKRLVAAAAFGAAMFPCAVAYASCDVHGGDDLLAWVNERAGTLSRQLAAADYTAREQGIFMSGLDEANKQLLQANVRLEALLDRMKSFESGAAKANATDAAILRENDAQDLLNELLSIQALLSDVRARQELLNVPPTPDWMKLNGLQNVGRATLLASFNQLGDDTRASLWERYSVSFKVTFDENGNAESASGGINQSGNWDDEVAMAVANYYPYGTAAAIFYEAIKFGISEEDCQSKINEQINKARQAYSLIPTVLIEEDEQLSEITASYDDASQKFSSTLALGVTLRQKLEDEWKAIFAYDAERIDTAHAVLTADKVAAIQQAFGSGSHLDSLLDSGAIIKLASDIAALNADLASRQRLVIGSCADVRGAEAVEDQVDGLKVAASIYDALGKRTGLAPLAPLLDASQAVDKDRSAEALAVRERLAARSCVPRSARDAALVSAASQVKPSTALGLALKREGRIRARAPAPRVLKGLSIVRANARFAAPLDLPDASGSLLCNLTRTGDGDWSCSGGGQSYDGSLDTTVGVASGANDGGYAEDNRRVQSEIGAATQNMEQRISQLESEAQALDAALPEWRDKNRVALAQYEIAANLQEVAAAGAQATFESANASQLASAKQSVDNFVTSPFDPARTQDLITKVGGGQLSLPAITSDRMVPELPSVAGVTATDRLFGSNATIAERRAMREGAKDDLELGGTDAPALAKREISMAKQFAGRSTATSQAIAQALLADAKSLRYAKSGEIPHAGYSITNDGQFARSDLGADGNPPADSILARGEAFNASTALFQQRADAVLASLNPSDANYAPRKTLVQSAMDMSVKASGLFFSGDLDNGERAQRAAFAVLDLATRFIPGVSWGRDVYEAVSGKDLFTGQDLRVAARATAILGAVTVGVGDEIVGIAHAFDEEKALEELAELGMSGERAREIMNATKTMKADSFEFTTHILYEMKAEEMGEISRSEVKDAINSGSKWWNSDKETVVALEKDPAPGSVRVGVGIDIDENRLTTAYRELKSDDVLRKTSIGGRGRYIQLTE
jgi:Pre-toxin TG